MSDLEKIINDAFEERENINVNTCLLYTSDAADE